MGKFENVKKIKKTEEKNCLHRGETEEMVQREMEEIGKTGRMRRRLWLFPMTMA